MFKKFIFMLITLCFLFHKTALLSSGEHPVYTHEGISTFELSPDAKEVILDDGLNKVLIWNTDSNSIVETIHISYRHLPINRIGDDGFDSEGTAYIRSCSNTRKIAISPNNRFIAIGSRGVKLTIYDRQLKKIVKIFEWDWISNDPNYQYYDSLQQVIVASIDFSSDSKFIFAGACDGRIRVISTDTLEVKKTIRAHSRCVQYLKVSDNKFYTVAYYEKPAINSTSVGYKEFKQWDLNTFQCNKLLIFKSKGYSPITKISSDGKFIFNYYHDEDISSSTYRCCFLNILYTETGKTYKNIYLGVDLEIGHFSISNDNNYIAINIRDTIKIFDIKSGRQTKSIKTFHYNINIQPYGSFQVGKQFGINNLRFSNESKYIISSGVGYEIKIHDIITGELIKSYKTRDSFINFKNVIHGEFVNPSFFKNQYKIRVLKVAANSFLRERNLSHSPENICDNNQETAWIPDRNSGVFLHNSIYFKVNTIPSSILVLPGFAASEKLWYKNKRVYLLAMLILKEPIEDFYKYMQLTKDSIILLVMKKENNMVPYKKYQYFNLKKVIKKFSSIHLSKSIIQFIILDTDKYKTIYKETAISEIMMFR